MFVRQLAVLDVNGGWWGLIGLFVSLGDDADRRNEGGKPPVPVDKMAQRATASVWSRLR